MERKLKIPSEQDKQIETLTNENAQLNLQIIELYEILISGGVI